MAGVSAVRVRDPSIVLTSAHFIPTLDGWRAVAIGAVVVSHLATFYRENSLLVHLGAQGVALFFAISGFLITTRLLVEHESTGTLSLRSFYIRRAFRILPPALVYLLTVSVLGLVGIIALRRLEVLSAAFFFNNYWPDRSWFTVHFWSLSIEEHFYFAWPIILLKLTPGGAKWFAAAVIAATLIWRPLGATVPLAVPPLQRTDMRLDAFMFACLLAILMRDRRIGPAVIAGLSKLWFRVAVPVALLGVYALAMRYAQWRLAKEFAQSALIPLIIGGTVAHSRDWIGQALDARPMQLVGRLSYGLYLWQELFLSSAIPVAFVGKVGLLSGVSVASYYGFERRCINLGRDLAKSATSARESKRVDLDEIVDRRSGHKATKNC